MAGARWAVYLARDPRVDPSTAVPLIVMELVPGKSLRELIESDGAVKLADFGVARLATSALTHTGVVVGSPAYMSPEQVQGEDAGES